MVFGTAVYSLINIMLVNQVDETLTQTSRDIISSTRIDSVGDLDVVILPQFTFTSNLFVQVWDNNHKLNSSSQNIGGYDQPLDPEGLDSKLPRYRDILIQEVHMRTISVPLLIGDRPIGTLQIASGTELIFSLRKTLFSILLITTLFSMFLADVSHELRTPLTVIKANADLLRMMNKIDLESLNSIKDETDRLTRMVGDLLLLAQADTGRLPLNFKPIELDCLLFDTLKDLKPLAGDRIQLKVVDIDQVLIKGDMDRIQQVIVNLVSNAIKYTPGKGTVSITLDKNDDLARLVIADTGPGISKDDLPHIFERFYRAEKSRTRSKSSGFGLGLSIVYWIVNAHGGRIEAESEEGNGTTFTVWLPLASENNGLINDGA